MAKRWIERFDNYSRALGQLKSAVTQKDYSELERARLIQLFEYTFELGYVANSPRESIQNAVTARLISEADGYEWIDAMKQRNLPSHTDDEQRSLDAEALIKQRYFVIVERLPETVRQV